MSKNNIKKIFRFDYEKLGVYLMVLCVFFSEENVKLWFGKVVVFGIKKSFENFW